MSYGLKGKVRQMVTEMQKLRDPGQGKIGRDITLRQFMAENYKDPNGKAARARASVRRARISIPISRPSRR
jgi:hypothetical protein